MATKTSARSRNGAGSTPRPIWKSGDDQTATKSSGSEEAGFEDSDDGEALGIGENSRRDNLVGTKRLAGVDEGGKNLAALFTFRCEEAMMVSYLRPEDALLCSAVCDKLTRHGRRKGVMDAHLVGICVYEGFLSVESAGSMLRE